MKRAILAVTFLALVGTAPALMAQDVEREQQRREEAERQLQEAQVQLERAIQQLREAESQGAQRQIEQAIAALRAAQRELRTDFRYNVITRPGRRGGVSVYSYGNEMPQFAMFGNARPRIGVIVQMNRDEDSDPIGAKLAAVTPGGPADDAGLEAGDIVIEANGVSLASSSRRDNPGEKFIEIVGELEEGDELRVTYQRDGVTHTAALSPRVMESDSFFYSFGDSTAVWSPLQMERFDPQVFVQPRTLMVDPPTITVEPREMIARIVMPHRWLNVELVALDEDLGAYFGTGEGLLVIRAPGDADLGLQSGDVILSIDGRAPTSPSHALRILRSYEQGEAVSMQIMRNKNRMTVDFTVPENDWKFDFER